MPTAKSYENCEIVREPYTKNGRQYVVIIKNGKEKEVRWYSEAQRNTMDNKVNGKVSLKFSPKNGLGFDVADYIVVFYGDESRIREWRSTLPRWTIWENTFFGFFMPADHRIENIPEDIHTIKVYWDDIRDPNDKENKYMKPNTEVAAYVQKLIKEKRNDYIPRS